MAVGELAEAKIFLDDTPGISALEMRAKARRLKNEQKALDLLIVDYLQFMSGRGRIESRQQEVSQISRELKTLAKEFNVPLVALSQLSRAPETRTGSHKPQLSDLRSRVRSSRTPTSSCSSTARSLPARNREAEHRRDHRRQAAQRADRQRRTRLPQGAHPVRGQVPRVRPMTSDGPRRPTWAEISFPALRHNYRTIRGHLGAGVQLMAVVKADAYGHGAVACARALAGEEADWFGVALVEEGAELRAAGIRQPVCCLGGFWRGQGEAVIAHDLTPAVFRMEAAEELNARAREAGRVVNVHLKVDTGMGGSESARGGRGVRARAQAVSNLRSTA